MGISRLRTHWAIELSVVTRNLEKGRKLQYSFHFRSFAYFCLFAFTSFPYWFFTMTSPQHMEHRHVSTDTETFTDRSVSTDTYADMDTWRKHGHLSMDTDMLTGHGQSRVQIHGHWDVSTDTNTDIIARTWSRARKERQTRVHKQGHGHRHRPVFTDVHRFCY